MIGHQRAAVLVAFADDAGAGGGRRRARSFTSHSSVGFFSSTTMISSSPRAKLRMLFGSIDKGICVWSSRMPAASRSAGRRTVRKGLTVFGTVMGSGAYVDSSDARLKRNVAPLSAEDAAAAIDALSPVRYDFRTEDFPERALPGGPQLGFLAHEVERVLPSLVRTGEDGFKYLS